MDKCPKCRHALACSIRTHQVDGPSCKDRQIAKSDQRIAALEAEVEVLERALLNLYCASLSPEDLYIAPPESWKDQARKEIESE